MLRYRLVSSSWGTTCSKLGLKFLHVRLQTPSMSGVWFLEVRLRPRVHSCSCLFTGDEVTISYKADLGGTARRRQRDLQSGWQFACSCSRCMLEQELPADIQDMIASLQHELDGESCQSGTIVAEYRSGMQRLLSTCFDTAAHDLTKELSNRVFHTPIAAP